MGRDPIAKTDGTMTPVFRDLGASDITQKKSGVITKKSDAEQTVTVQGWQGVAIASFGTLGVHPTWLGFVPGLLTFFIAFVILPFEGGRNA